MSGLTIVDTNSSKHFASCRSTPSNAARLRLSPGRHPRSLTAASCRTTGFLLSYRLAPTSNQGVGRGCQSHACTQIYQKFQGTDLNLCAKYTQSSAMTAHEISRISFLCYHDLALDMLSKCDYQVARTRKRYHHSLDRDVALSVPPYLRARRTQVQESRLPLEALYSKDIHVQSSY
jgi:hypothetical protein